VRRRLIPLAVLDLVQQVDHVPQPLNHGQRALS
jgi:hypothetical protein